MQRGAVRHWPFESKYLRDFEVVEERRNGVRLFPHTDQLPLLSQAINREFEAGLTTRMAGTDARANAWRKLQLRQAAHAFCCIVNAARPDHLHVQPCYTPDLVARIAVVQHLTKSCPGGLAHWFRFFRGADFLPDVYLSGKRLVFASHVIDRYAERAVCTTFHPLALFLLDFFGNAKLPAVADDSPAVAFRTEHSMVAMPYEATADEYFFLTTLSPNEITTLTLPTPLPPLHLHYGPAYNPPAKIMDRTRLVEIILKHWREKTPPEDGREHERLLLEHMTYTGLVKQVDRILTESGHTDQTRFMFHDGIHGPFTMTGELRR